MDSGNATHSDSSRIRYAQCWEDADVLLTGLDIQPDDTCLSIASAGDNTLSMLVANPARVIAVDLNPAQLACLELRVAAYRNLEHQELLELIGSRQSDRRPALYGRCKGDLSHVARTFWDARPAAILGGIGAAGKFEGYFRLFRRVITPLVHRRATIDRLLEGGDHAQRERFYESTWNNRRWRWLFHTFFSRFVMGRLGRQPGSFKYVDGSVSDRILTRTRHGLVELDPSENPYLQWILTGRHTTALPHALRPDNFELIRARLDRLDWRLASLEDVLIDDDTPMLDRLNLSDVFEYMSQHDYHAMLELILAKAAPHARLAYWNMLAPRTRPDHLAHRLESLEELAQVLHERDRAFFYSRFVIEERLPE